MHTDTADTPRPDGSIALYLTADEALVLEAFLSRARAAGDDYSIQDQAELRVLWDMAATLENRLPLVNNSDYDRLLAAALDRVRDSLS
jgi:hypothetical protein